MNAPVLTATVETWPLARTFRISRESRDAATVVVATLTAGPHTGRGESVPYRRYGESPDSVLAEINAFAKQSPQTLDHDAIMAGLPAGAARNAVDCALWDLRAKQTGARAWSLAGLDAPPTMTSAYTISLDTPDAMAAQAAEHRHYPLLKLKVTGDGDLERVRAIRAAAPEPALLVDANEAWRPEQLVAFDAEMAALGVIAIEQPLPAGQDDALLAHKGQVPFCADESCHTAADLPSLAGKYQMVNIKLDKAGGLTAALELLAGARTQGFSVMVGCMVGTSLAMAPAMLMAASAEVVDLDGPWLLAEDRAPSLLGQGMHLEAIDPTLWG